MGDGGRVDKMSPRLGRAGGGAEGGEGGEGVAEEGGARGGEWTGGEALCVGGCECWTSGERSAGMLGGRGQRRPGRASAW